MNDPDFKPKLGKLPKIPGRPALKLRTLGAVAHELPAPPVEVHNIELDPDTDILGNNTKSDCVAVMIERNRRIAAAALGVKITWLTTAQVLDNYFKMTGGPDSGLVIQRALEWTKSLTAGWGGSHLLCFARVPHTELAIRQAISEFQSVGMGVEIHASQMYPSKKWDVEPNDPYEGGHGVPGGSYDALFDFAKTWGYVVEITPAYFSKFVDEIDVLVWDFQWESLTYERQVSLVQDYEALTGKAWAGPAPKPPVQEFVPMSATQFTGIKAARVADSRTKLNGLGLLAVGLNAIKLWGLGGIPSGALDVSGKIEIINPTARGWVNVGPDAAEPVSSTLWFPADTMAHSMSFLSALAADGTLYIWNGTKKALAWDLDITGFFTA